MNLFLTRQVTYKYNYDILIPQLIEVSRENIKRRRHCDIETTTNAMCSISMGRQTGKTSGIIDYARRHPNTCIVITHCPACVEHYNAALRDRNALIISSRQIIANPDVVRGIRGEYDFIFDECTTDEVHKAICNLHVAGLIGENMMVVRSILKVGDQ